MGRGKLEAVFLSGFGGGVIIRSFLDFGWKWPAFLAGLSLVLFIFFLLAKRRIFFLAALLFLGLALGIGRYIAKDVPPNLSWFEERVGREVEIKATVIDEPEEKENYTRLVVAPENLRGMRIFVYARHYPRLKYGDELAIKGKIQRPKNFDRRFDWVAYLSKDDIYYQIFYPEIEKVGEGNVSAIKGFLFAVKRRYLYALARLLPEPQASLAGGITVGAKQSLGKFWLEIFRRTGIIHIVVLSGYNVSLIADIGMKVLAYLPNFLRFSFGVFGIALFALMVGASPAVVRASIMASLLVLARTSGRVYEVNRALFAAGFLMVLYNPKILVFDTGFQLSFLATFSLIHFAPWIERKISFITDKFKIREIIAATIAAQAFVFPLILYKMGFFSLVSLPVNALVLPAVPPAMFFSFAAGLLGMVWYPLAVPFAWLAYFFLQYVFWVVKFFASLPFASLAYEDAPLALILSIYIFYGACLYLLLKGRRSDL